MADLPVQPMQNYGQLLSSYGEGLANQENATTNAANSNTNLVDTMARIPLLRAQAGLTTAQEAGADIANQNAALKLQLLHQALDQQSATANASANASPAPTAEGETSDNSGESNPDDYAGARAHMQEQFANNFKVNPAYTPAEMANVQRAIPLAIAGDNNFFEAAQKQHEIRVQQQTANASYAAQRAYDSSYAVASAPEGSHYTAFAQSQPVAAANLARNMGLDPNHPETWTAAQKKTLDDHVKIHAEMANNELFQYTGDKLEDKDGQIRNSRTGLTPLGDQTQGLSPKENAELFTKGSQIVDTTIDGRPTKLQQYQADGYSSLGAWRAAAAANNGVAPPRPGSPNSSTPAPTSNTGPTKTGAVANGVSAGQAPASVSAAVAQTPVARNTQLAASVAATAANSKIATTPQDQAQYATTLGTALADPEYKASLPPAPKGGGSYLPNEQKELDNYSQSKQDLKSSADEVSSASARALQNFMAAKQILEAPAKGPVQGLPGVIAGELAKLGLDTDTADHRMEAIKYLTNGALGNLKTTYGSKPAMFDVKVNLEQAFPDLKTQGIGAVKNLIDSNIRAARYDIDSAGRVGSYIDAGNDPARFNNWNESHFARAAGVNEPAVRLAIPAQAKLQAYANAHFGGDLGKATAFLRSKGYQ